MAGLGLIYGTVTGAIEKSLDAVYGHDWFLGGIAKNNPNRIPPPKETNPNRSILLSELQQKGVSPEMIRGFQVNWTTPIGERLSRTAKWSFCGKGNPMMGMPGSGYEASMSWQGGEMTAQGPKWQCNFSPFTPSDIISRKFRLQSQIVRVGDTSQNVFVNDWDIDNWNMFLHVGSWSPKIRNQHFKISNRIQAQGGLLQLFNGQSQMETEVAWSLGQFKKMNTTVGLKMQAIIPPLSQVYNIPFGWKDSANPFIILSRHNTVFQEDQNLNSENIIGLSYDRSSQKVNLDIISQPVQFQDPFMEMSTKNPEFMKNIGQEVRKEKFSNWVGSEKNSYHVKADFSLKSKQFGYSIGTIKKFINMKTDMKMEMKARSGDLVPSILSVSLSENALMGKETSPITTGISMIYDSSKADSVPDIGLSFNIEL